MKEITMPRLSDTMTEGTVARWLKNVGEKVSVGETLCEIETDKAVMDYEAFEAGTLTKIVVGEGETAQIGAVIAILDGDEGAGEVAGEEKREREAALGEVIESHEAEHGVITPAEVAQATERLGITPVSVVSDEGERRLGSPLVRRLAREHHLDLDGITGSGPGGRIVRADVEHLLDEATVTKVTPVTAKADELRQSERVVLSNVRRVIARRLETATTVPVFYLGMRVDAGALVEARSWINEERQATGQGKISVNDLVVRAVAVALVEHPGVNASWGGDGESVLVHHKINVGVAMASAKGLVVPVVRETNTKSAGEVAAEITRLAQAANGDGLKLEQMQGGTFSISNLGMYGVADFTAVLNPPEAAILAVGAIRAVPMVREGGVVAGQELALTLTVDHRVIDGAAAAEFMGTLKSLLEHPGALA